MKKNRKRRRQRHHPSLPRYSGEVVLSQDDLRRLKEQIQRPSPCEAAVVGGELLAQMAGQFGHVSDHVKNIKNPKHDTSD